MTLEEAKKQAYETYMMQLNMMNDMIDHPEQLRSCGYKTLEDYLKSAVKHTHKEIEKIFVQYEKSNPG